MFKSLRRRLKTAPHVCRFGQSLHVVYYRRVRELESQRAHTLPHNAGILGKTGSCCKKRSSFLFCDRYCKPGSVIDSHLSRRTVAGTLKPPPRRRSGKPYVSSTVLLRIEFTAPQCSHAAGELLPRLSILTPQCGAVSLCCTFPEVAFGGRYPLSLPCGARTFLTYPPFAGYARLSVPVA